VSTDRDHDDLFGRDWKHCFMASSGGVRDQTQGYSVGSGCPKSCGGIVTHRETTGTDRIKYAQCSRCHWNTL